MSDAQARTASCHLQLYFDHDHNDDGGDGGGDDGRHDICQKNYTTSVFGAKILHKKCVNRDNGKFTTNQRKDGQL